VLSCLSLYIFVDKYSVHQLHDDFMTAMFAQSTSWEQFPEPTPHLLTTVYNNLPSSAKFHRLIILCIAYFWLTEAEANPTVRLRSLHEWQPNLAFEISVALTQMMNN
jgi:hypothetical protein